MKILESNKKLLQLFGMCSLEEGSAPHLRTIQVVITSVEFFCLVFFVSVSALYFVKHYPPFEDCVLAVAQLVGVFQSYLAFISLLPRAKKVRDFFDEIQGMFDSSEWK